MINYPALLAVIQEAYDDNWTPECLANYILQELASHEAEDACAELKRRHDQDDVY